MHPIYCSYYTPDYKQSADQLHATLERFGLPHDLCELEESGRWIENCSKKAKWLLACMEKHKRPVVWVDADARVEQWPERFQTMPACVDLACHYLDGHELLSGSLYFGYTTPARDLLIDWSDLCGRVDGEWDQRLLQRAVDESRNNLTISGIPESYVYIFDRGTVPDDQVVIRHLQYSRLIAK